MGLMPPLHRAYQPRKQGHFLGRNSKAFHEHPVAQPRQRQPLLKAGYVRTEAVERRGILLHMAGGDEHQPCVSASVQGQGTAQRRAGMDRRTEEAALRRLAQGKRPPRGTVASQKGATVRLRKDSQSGGLGQRVAQPDRTILRGTAATMRQNAPLAQWLCFNEQIGIGGMCQLLHFGGEGQLEIVGDFQRAVMDGEVFQLQHMAEVLIDGIHEAGERHAQFAVLPHDGDAAVLRTNLAGKAGIEGLPHAAFFQ